MIKDEALARAYAALGVPPGASSDAIADAHRELLRALSPERFSPRDPVRKHLQSERRGVDAALELLQTTGAGGDPSVACPDPSTVANLRVELSVHEFRLSRWRSQIATAIAGLCMGVGLSLVFLDASIAIRLVFFALILGGGLRAMQVWQVRGLARKGIARTASALERAMRGAHERTGDRSL